MCEELGLATSVQNQYDDTKDSHTYVFFYLLSHGVCNSRHKKNLEGEQDSGQQTLATWTCLRSHCSRRVVLMVLVIVKVQCEKSMFLYKYEMWFV